MLDNTPYFRANDVHDYVEDTAIELCHLPRDSAPVNPAEECWHQLNQRLGNRFSEEIDALSDAVFDALDAIEPLNLSKYLCP